MALPLYSIIILSYQRDTVVQENLAHLAALLADHLENIELVLVDNNADGVDRSAYLQAFPHEQYVALSENKGVTGGRNAGIAAATGQYLLFLDDDGFLENAEYLETLHHYLEGNPTVGIIAAKSLRLDGQPAREEIPHTDKTKDLDTSWPTHRYIGVAHVIRRELFEQLGPYDEDFFYAMEEFDFSYRAIKAGWEIHYHPSLAVEHRKVETGRLPEIAMQERTLLNRLKVNYRHLPQPYYIASTALWLGYTLYRSSGRVKIGKVYNEFRHWRAQHQDQRQPLGKEALVYIKKCGVQLWKG